MIVKPASVGARFADMVTALTPTTAMALKAAGIDGVYRYLGSLATPERDAILGAGLQLGVVTYSRDPNWVPTPGMGTTDGQGDLAHLQAAGIPDGVTPYIDLEGCAGTAEQATQWLEERCDVLENFSASLGLYVGSFQPLGATQLYALPRITSYWRSLSQGVPEPWCGWGVVQLRNVNGAPVVIAGVEVDLDVVQADYKGRFPMVLSAA
jgi:hypothetical protein